MSEWTVETVEELDALPVDTTLAVLWPSGAEERFIAEEDTDGLMVWAGTAGNYEDSGQLAHDATSIRVVSVPIEELLADGAQEAMEDAAWSHMDDVAEATAHALRAAIAHVIRGRGLE